MATKQYVHVSNTNTKLGASILSINLPAGITCRADAPCAKGCYAMKGNWLYPSVKNSLQGNRECQYIFINTKHDKIII